jgi:hypothetical protein
VLPLQHPPAHEVPSQTHWPELVLHSCPAPHAAQAAPAVPQAALDSAPYGTQTPLAPPLQQPLGHVVASHAQAPCVLSHSPFAQTAQSAPPAPHCEADCDAKATQALPAQQPLGHEAASQTQRPVDVSHSWPAPQDAQLAPAVPQDALDSDAHGTQVLPRQQPLGHDVASQTHCPLPLQSWPDAHVRQAAPAAPHEALLSLASGSHVAPLQHPVQDAPPHVQAPLVQACPDPQGLHAAPPVPHWLPDCDGYGTHVSPLQHPVGHELASQTHRPVLVLHSWPAAHAAQVPPAAPHETLDSEA